MYVTRLTDEDGNISYEFKDKLGQVVLTRQMEGTVEHDTYYIYDSYGNLRVVLPPLAADNLSAGTWDESNTYLQQYAYLYKYDSRNRCIAKKLPGAEWIYNIYDKADRLIFTQDGEQRTRGEWTFNISDVHGRAVLSGTCNNTLNYTTQLNTVVVGNWIGNESIYKGYEVNGVTLTTPKVLSVNFYDSYDFMDKNGIPSQYNSHYSYNSDTGFNDRNWDSEKGLHTGSLSALLDGADRPTYMISVMYYDKQGRMIQNHTQSHITNGVDKHCIRYSITGEPMRSEHLHAGKDKPTVTEYIDYEYDHARRLQTTYHQLRYIGDLGDRVALSQNSYDAVGRLKTKVFHGNAAQPITYSYNIRGWLTGIANTHFTENLYYNTGNSEPLYNGNISSMTWKVGSESNMRGYKFDYDGLSRLTQATYGEGNLIANNPNRFTEKVTGYDKHGNIMGLQRYGKTSSTAYGLIDNLTFGYTGNRMQYVNDAVTTSLADGTFHFVNASNSTGNEYMYDANGNLIKDSNKNITNIAYNLLNLPSSVQLSDNRTATYLYDAAGMKRKVTHQGGGENKMTEYCSNVIYENKMFNKVLTEEGYLTVVNHRPIYHYYLKDHLGNNRVVLNQDGTTVEQVSHYYPFGGVFDQTAEDAQRYKYNGKELDRTYGLDLYDYSARYMDGALARFTTMDPMAEKYYGISPYAYCANNPMRFVDPTGEDFVIWYNDENGKQRSFVFNGRNGDSAPNNQFVNDVITAYVYNVQNGGGKSMQEIATKNDFHVSLMETTYNSEYVGGYKAVYFNPSSALKLDDGYVLSPATILEHEMGHAVDHKKGKKDGSKDEKYGFVYEKEIILGPELETAKANGELPKNHKGRKSHSEGLRILTKGVTSTKEDNPKKSADFRIRIKERVQNSIKTFSSESL